MDADTLRLILIVAGGFLLVGLYLWEQRRARPDEKKPFYDQKPEEDKLEPRLDAWQGEEGYDGRDLPTSDGTREPSGSPAIPVQSELQLEPLASPPEGTAPGGARSPLILSLHITPKEGTFDGEAIVHAASKCGVEPGEMDVFHRYADSESSGNPLFSMANMVNPGTFPFGAMAEFESPGLTLFSQAEGASDDPGRLEVMLSTAHCLADELEAEIRDETRSPLTPEIEQCLRDRVLELVAWRLSGSVEK